MNPRVSFVVTCYNYGRFVSEAIESLLCQTLRDLEVIAIDDASTDDSADILRRYENNSRVRVIVHEKNRGHIRSYNEGLALARGAYVGVLAADDFANESDAVARQVDLFERYPDVGFVYSAHALVDTASHVTSISQPFESDYVISGAEEIRRLVWLNHVPHSGTLVRQTCHDELGYYDERLPHAGDWDLWLRVATRHDVAYVADPLYAYRIHGTNMSHAKVPPGQAVDELLLTLDRSFALLEDGGDRDLLALRGPARQRALYLTLWNDLAHCRTRRSWTGLGAIVRRSPGLLADAKLYTSFLRVLILTLAGPARYRRLYGGFAA